MKSRLNWPVGGWLFVDAPISETPLGDTSWSFDKLCEEVQNRRVLNPRFNLPVDILTIKDSVDEQNALRMLSIRGAGSYIVNDGGEVPKTAASRNHGWRNVAGGIKRVTAGASILRDWLGAGAQPVAAALSAQRAAVCATCPENQPGDLTSWFTEPVAALIRQQLESRSELKLSTPSDDKLGVCRACSCPLQLKPHVPLANITARLDEETKKRLDKNCWILSESAQ